MVAHEYNRADVAVRNTIDEYFEALQSKFRIDLPKTSIGQLGGAFKSLEGVGAEAGESVSRLFDVNLPAVPLSQPQTRLPDVAIAQPAPVPPPGGSANLHLRRSWRTGHDAGPFE
ncbi:hypothetical protein E0Z10_g6261 [Xylaria hypoxylon]|uniref:Uncharacterized protein n=1 Tax=Xylaria hypoxylon TaxID=37992 RepID=A0A4Z0YVN2_9PEZI|nr:hypothetical protein E0Z10_g6261 [Xylaria hypoxylon]